MKRYTSLSTCTLVLWLILTTGAFAQTASQETLQDRYRKAVENAEVANADEIYAKLTLIASCNRSLIWKDKTDPDSPILVTTWIDDGSRQYYPVNEEITISAGHEPWVTVAPQVKNFCTATRLRGPRLKLRLEQLLGLPSATNKSTFVELWVKPNDLFRPCPDPEITDVVCGLDYPQPGFMAVTQGYMDWFNNQKLKSYSPTSNGLPGYPWTRLGYTYDWGGPTNHVGVSEFIIKAGAVVKVNALPTTGMYCSHGRARRKR